MDFHHQMTIIKESIAKNTLPKQISPEKWRKLMLRCLVKLKNRQDYEGNLIDDLQTIVERIPEQMFVESVLNLQPFRPKFETKPRKSQEDKPSPLKDFNEMINISPKHKKQTPSTKSNNHMQSILKYKQTLNSRLTDSIAEELTDSSHGLSLLDQALSIMTDEKTLSKQFEAKHHPYRRIIEQFLFIIQNKYRNYVGGREVDIEEVQRMLLCDLNCLQEFIIKSSQPYLHIFRSQNIEEKQIFIARMAGFIKQYIERHEKINQSIRKVMRQAGRKGQLIQHLQVKLPNFIEVTDFQIPPDFTIEGCYLQSMNSLIQFSQCSTPEESLQTLKQVRMLINADIDDYYHQHPQIHRKSEQITAECQLQVLKFMLCKLKTFLPEIYGQLMYLEVVLGEDDMCMRYDDSSYMYAQLVVACKSLELDFP